MQPTPSPRYSNDTGTNNNGEEGREQLCIDKTDSYCGQILTAHLQKCASTTTAHAQIMEWVEKNYVFVCNAYTLLNK